MTLDSSLQQNGTLSGLLETERQNIWWTHPDWSEAERQQEWLKRKAELAAIILDESSTPRYLRHGLGGTGTSPALAQGADRARFVGGFSWWTLAMANMTRLSTSRTAGTGPSRLTTLEHRSP